MVGFRPAERTEYYGPFRLKPDKIFRANNRALNSTVTQLRTGHGYFNSYLYKIPTNNTMTNQCNCRGNSPQTPAHLILWCPIHQRARQRMRALTPKIPRLRLQLLLYTNMGADALGSYLTPPEWPHGDGNSDLTDNKPPRKRDDRS